MQQEAQEGHKGGQKGTGGNKGYMRERKRRMWEQIGHSWCKEGIFNDKMANMGKKGHTWEQNGHFWQRKVRIFKGKGTICRQKDTQGDKKAHLAANWVYI